jgi:hypothetical protein
MAKAVTLDGITLYELWVVQNPPGQVSVQAVFALLSGSQIVSTTTQNLTLALNATEMAAVTAAMTAIQGALVRTQLS